MDEHSLALLERMDRGFTELREALSKFAERVDMRHERLEERVRKLEARVIVAGVLGAVGGTSGSKLLHLLGIG